MPVSFPKRNSTPSKLPYSAKQSSLKRNTSILNFFQKTDAPTSTQPRITEFTTKAEKSNNGANGAKSQREENSGAGSLFLEDSTGSGISGGKGKRGDEIEGLEDTDGFPVKVDEEGLPVKKRRASTGSERSLFGDEDLVDGGEKEIGISANIPNENGGSVKRRKRESSPLAGKEDEPKSSNISTPAKSRQSGPFIDESDSEEEDLGAFRDVEEPPAVSEFGQSDTRQSSAVNVPPLVREATSHAEDDEEFANFDDLEENEFREEEFLEPLCDEEMEQDGLDESIGTDTPGEESVSDGVPVCPICQTSLPGSSEMV